MRLSINKLALFSVFLDNLFIPLNLGFDFRINYILQALFIVYYVLTSKKLVVDVKSILILTVFFFVSLATVLIQGFYLALFFKQTVLILFQLIFAWLLLSSYQFNFKRIASDYLSIIAIICAVGALQFLSFKLGFKPGADYSYLGFDMGNLRIGNHRIQAWFQEPSFMVYALIPAAFMALASVFKISNLISPRFSAAIILIIILSKSSIGYAGLIICMALIILSKYPIVSKPIFLTIASVMAVLASIYLYNIPEMKMRVDDTLDLLSSKEISGEQIDKINLSTYALYSNYKVASSSVKEDFLFGKGLGQYASIYDSKINEVVPKSIYRENFKLNREDANSLLFRLLAETGFLATAFFIIFVVTNRVKWAGGIAKGRLFWTINNGIFVLILLRLLRQGHYSMLGFILFLIIFYKTFKANKKDAFKTT